MEKTMLELADEAALADFIYEVQNHTDAKDKAAKLWPLLRSSAGVGVPFQKRVQAWMMECFSMEICRDTTERNHRFLEESLELVQSLGCTRSEAHQLVEYVFGREVGEPNQEVGGVKVTLAALCLAADLDMDTAGETELARIWTKIDKIRAKQAAKPKHSPLPEAAPAPVGMDTRQIKPCTYGYQYPDNTLRFNEGREVNGMRPTATVPFYDQKTIDRLLVSIPQSPSPTVAWHCLDKVFGTWQVIDSHLAQMRSRYPDAWEVVPLVRLAALPQAEGVGAQLRDPKDGLSAFSVMKDQFPELRHPLEAIERGEFSDLPPLGDSRRTPRPDAPAGPDADLQTYQEVRGILPTPPAGGPVAWLDVRTAGLGWQNRIVATNPQFVANNGPENFAALYATPQAQEPAEGMREPTPEMVDAALNAWFKSPPSETDIGLERSMKAALVAAALAASPRSPGGTATKGDLSKTIGESENGWWGSHAEPDSSLLDTIAEAILQKFDVRARA